MIAIATAAASEPASGEPPLARLDSIQFLRAMAAIAVVAFHALQSNFQIVRFGDRGVDLFFVISGFIMFRLAEARSIGVKQFAIDRAIRIIPMYWIATISVFALAVAGKVMWGASDDFGRLIKSLLFIPHYNADGRIWPIVFLGWTLNMEAFFYLVFAVLLPIRQRLRLPIMIGLFAALVLLGAIRAPINAIERTYTSPMMLEFAAGAIIGYISGWRRGRFVFAFGLLALTMGVLGTWLPRIWFGWIAVLLVAGGLALERRGWMPSLPLLALLGDASYSIYLFQQFAFEGWGRLANRFFHGPDWVSNVMAVIMAVVLGVMVHVSLERPLIRWVRDRVRRTTHGPVRIAEAEGQA